MHTRDLLPATCLGLLLSAAPASSLAPPDYILLDHCLATAADAPPPAGAAWQPGGATVHLRDASTGTGGWTERHTHPFTAYAYRNGANGYPEYGTGDDVCLGRADELAGTLLYDVVPSAPDAAAGTFSLADTPAGKYGRDTDLSATIDRSFDLTSLTDIRLVFFHHHALIWSVLQDTAAVEVNTGSGWQRVDPESTPSGDFYAYYLGDKHVFERGEADLSAFAGEPSLQIRFRLTTNAFFVDDGWFIDDVRLLGDGATLFLDDFESGTAQWVLDPPWGQSLASYSYDPTLGTIDAGGLYTVTPVGAPVAVGAGVGLNLVQASYIENGDTLRAYAKVYHTSPLFVVPPDLGPAALCEGTVGVDAVMAPVHRRLVLRQNAPNPFNPSTAIAFRLDAAARATLRIYDESGRLVRSLLTAERLPAGEHELDWDGRDARGAPRPSGVYLYRLTVGDQTLSRKMVMVR